MKILLASFYTPGIRAIEYLIQAGFRPEQIRLLTYEAERNAMLVAFARAHGIEMCTSAVNSPEGYEWIKSFKPDALFSLYYRDIVPQKILEMPPLGAVNLHPALLPKYKGTFSAPWVIINGEKFTGFTYHYMVSQVDAGNIVLQRRVRIKPDDTAYSLYHRLLIRGMDVFGEAYHLVLEERYPGRPQSGPSSYYPRKLPNGGFIDPTWDHERIDRFIRAMFFPPFKGAMVQLADGSAREVVSISEYKELAATGMIINKENFAG